MLRILSISLLITVVVFSSCNNDNTKTTEKSEVTLSQIKGLEAQLFDASITKPDVKKALELGKMYVEYAELHPTDSIAPDLLYKAADISMNVGNPKLSVAIFKRIATQYPNYRNLPTVIFLTGYVYENQLNDYEKAKTFYEIIIEKYPESDFADDAEISLKNLGKSPEEMIKEFEKAGN